MTPGPARGSSEFALLTRTFLARFVDTEVTGGSADLRTSLFWILAFLAAPGIFMPVLNAIAYDVTALAYGLEALEVAARGNKAFYVGFAMVASGALSVMLWNSLLLERRDSLVLGTLPVRSATIVRAKLVALVAYIGLAAVAMHGLASISFGFCLAARNTPSFALAGIVAHFTASTAASAFVLLAVTAVQGVLLVLLGPRRFDAVSPLAQLGLVATVLAGLMILPDLDFPASGPPAWLLWTPPLWFLGVYERMLGVTEPMFVRLSHAAMAALAITAVLTLVTYPLAYRRVTSAAVEGNDRGRRKHRFRALTALAVKALGRSTLTRASAQFLLASVARNSRHRFVLAASAGLSVAVGAPVLFHWLPQLAAPPPMPPVALLALPLHVTVFFLVGWRVAVALPTDLRAGWAVGCIGPPSPELRAGVWRLMFAAGVAPITVAMAVMLWRAWGPFVAATHALLCFATGAALTEALLWGFDDLPCSRPWRPERANLRFWWPAYLFGFFMITGSLPALERLVLDTPAAALALVAVPAAIGVALRVTHRRRHPEPDEDPDEAAGVQLLNLN